MKTIIVINGPNLNLVGQREPLLYGTRSIDEYFKGLKGDFSEVHISHVQTNSEEDIIVALHDALQSGAAGVVLNPAAYTHTSIAIADAVAALCGAGIPVIEVHISNIYAREIFRHHSYVSKVASGVITGLGLEGYRLAIAHLHKLATD